eukprot:CAMPEP_0179000450 /NCGR_PEP_ID=MMETSP0795-20121207/10687_1 /TAXON_ID=88552 /ORGANISM="Amoebophrya sp., Strain Ameob2" /LENGTH=135 /DNA_ID=CAMNT_0020693465 /DNA_START=476 /DNA_END=880 /DNA_ORIENTATION=+
MKSVRAQHPTIHPLASLSLRRDDDHGVDSVERPSRLRVCARRGLHVLVEKTPPRRVGLHHVADRDVGLHEDKPAALGLRHLAAVLPAPVDGLHAGRVGDLVEILHALDRRRVVAALLGGARFGVQVLHEGRKDLR